MYVSSITYFVIRYLPAYFRLPYFGLLPGCRAICTQLMYIYTYMFGRGRKYFPYAIRTTRASVSQLPHQPIELDQIAK